MDVQRFSVKTKLNTLTNDNYVLKAEIDKVVKLMSRVRMEGLAVFGFYVRWLFSQPGYSQADEAHLRLNMFSDVFVAKTEPTMQKRNWLNTLRQCTARKPI
jgi:hypothetical protein